MTSRKRTALLRAGQQSVLLPEGLFMIDRRERPPEGGWYEIEYDPADQFLAAVRKEKPAEKCEPDLSVGPEDARGGVSTPGHPPCEPQAASGG
jgi:hypothetical protein